jgi:succinyl-diaminopimelate desuccinylase
MTTDPVDLTAALVRCPSVTPEEGGALTLLQEALEQAGFECTRVDRNGTPNLFARWGERNARRVFGFNGHTDVVPVGDPADWTHPPFSAHREDGWLMGRGATDMKSGVAAFVAAAIDLVTETPPDGAIVIAITGDEEGPGRDGTIAILDWMAETGERMDVCIVGEPTCVTQMGDMVKIGRRGSMTAHFVVTGKQGHSAYLHKALNPMPAVALLAHRLSTHVLDEGTEHFDPSTISVTTIDTGNTASNVIPARTRMSVNIRFNDLHSGAGLSDWLREEAERVAAETDTQISVRTQVSGEAFLTPPGPLSRLTPIMSSSQGGCPPEAFPAVFCQDEGGVAAIRTRDRHDPPVAHDRSGACPSCPPKPRFSTGSPPTPARPRNATSPRPFTSRGPRGSTSSGC